MIEKGKQKHSRAMFQEDRLYNGRNVNGLVGIGISTSCFYPMETERVLEKEIALGFRTYEVFFNSPSELEESFVRGLKKQADAAKGKIVSLHPFTSGYESYLLFSQYRRRFKDGLLMYDGYFRAAKLLGADILVIHGEKNRPFFSDEEYLERFRILAERGKRFGVRVAQENVVEHRSQNPEFIRKMRRELKDNAYFVLDIKQCIRSRVSPFEMCDAMGDRLIHLHANDHSEERDCVLPGEGKMDYRRLFAQMKAAGFSGSCVLEVYRDAIHSEEELVRAGRTLEAFAKQAGWGR